MSGTVDLSVLWKKLSRAKREKQAPAPCSHLVRSEPDKELTESVSYLVANVLDPLCRGERVHTGDLDFSRFAREDIWELFDFYSYRCYVADCDWHKLKGIYDTCCAAVPEVCLTGETGYV